jgi:hypothetical protein
MRITLFVKMRDESFRETMVEAVGRKPELGYFYFLMRELSAGCTLACILGSEPAASRSSCATLALSLKWMAVLQAKSKKMACRKEPKGFGKRKR